MEYHIPVLCQESVEALITNPAGIYVDATFGGGGHSREIVQRLEDPGFLYGFDQDADVAKQAAEMPTRSFKWIQANFKYLKKYLRLEGCVAVDGVLADLGVSSHQFDTPERGFSLRFTGPLDMRMDASADLSAQAIIANYAEADLVHLLSAYAELRNARTVASAIVRERTKGGIETTTRLVEVIKPYAPYNSVNQFLARVFQALRMEANDELGALKAMLEESTALLKPGGKFVVISYHSLEDRLVKHFFQTGNWKGQAEKDFYGNLIRPLEPEGKVQVPGPEEIARNPRARSAKMRIAIKK